MKRKLLLLSLLGILIGLPVLARDFEYTYEGQTMVYTVLDEDAKTCATKSGYFSNGSDHPGNDISGKLVLPSNPIDGDIEYVLKTIGDRSFESCYELTEVTIPNSVTTIDTRAFYWCSGLTEVTIGNSVTTIGLYAFWNCSNLREIRIPDSVTDMGNGVFSGCSGLTEVTIGNSLTRIASGTFSGCSGLTEVTIPNSVMNIMTNAFSNCGNLTSFNILDGDTEISIAENNFSDTQVQNLYVGRDWTGPLPVSKNLTTLTIGDSVTRISDRIFDDCSGLKEVTIGNSVTSIGNYAFYRCSGLTELTIGNSVTSIGNYAFWNCGLKSVTIGESVASIGDEAFSCCYGLTAVTIPNSVISIGASAFSECKKLMKVEIGNSVTSISDGSFSGCSGMNEITIPTSVTSIGKSAFSGCSGLKEVTIPNSVTSIGSSAFYGCSGLRSFTVADGDTDISFESNVFGGTKGANIRNLYVGRDWTGKLPISGDLSTLTIGNSVTSIGGFAFYGCSGLTELTIPNSVTTIGDNAFSGCSGLTEVTIPNSVTTIGGSAFSGCSGLKELTIGNSVTSIGGYAFSGCSGLTEFTIPNSVTSIGKSAFSGCSGLTSFTIADGDTDISIQLDAFGDTKGPNIRNLYVGRDWTGKLPISGSLSTLTIGNLVTSIGNAAFSGCSGLRELTIGNSVTNIGYNAFFGCRGLTKITIPNSVTIIDESAFEGCSGLTEVSIGNSVTSIGDFAFSGCSGLTEVTIPNAVMSIGNSAFSGCSSLTEVKIPDSVTSIGSFAFSRCSGLASFIISDGDTEISIGGDNFNDTQVQSLYVGRDWTGPLPISKNLTTLTIGGFVTSIGESAFKGCSGLTEVTILNSVTSIGEYAFDGCSGLTKVVFTSLEHLISIDFGSLSSNPLWNAHNLYIGETKVDELVVPTTIVEIKAYTFAGGNFNLVDIPNSVMKLGKDAFADCVNISNVRFEDGKSPLDVADDVFQSYKDNKSYELVIDDLYLGRNIPNKTSLLPRNLVIGNLVTEFYNFKGNSYLESLSLGSGLTAIPADAFNGCSLREVVVPVNVTDIGKNAFANNKLTNLSMGSKIVNIGANAFEGNTIDTVNVAAITPPKASYTSFSDYSGKLYVPSGSVEDYGDSWNCWVHFTGNALVDLEKIEGSTEYISGNVGETVQLSVTLTPANISLPYVFWSSTNPEVATVDNDGLVTFVGGPDSGECKIIAETLYDTDKIATFKVNSISTGIFEIVAEEGFEEFGGTDVERAKDIFTLQGVCLKRNATKDDIDALAPGIYIIAGKKIIVK